MKPTNRTSALALAIVLLISTLAGAAAQTPQRVWSPPAAGTFWSATYTNYPPMPYLPFDVPVYSMADGSFLFDDTAIDYPTLSELLTTETLAPSPPGSGGTNSISHVPRAYNYSSNDLWLEIQRDPSTPDYVDLTLHGTTNGYYQLLSKEHLTDPAWGFGEIVPDYDGTNTLFFTPIPDNPPPTRFFRAVSGNTTVSVRRALYSPDPQEPCSLGTTGQVGVIDVNVDPTLSAALTVIYTISGSAINGTDYTNISNAITIPPNTANGYIYINPYYDTNVEFSESVTLSLVLTNGYLVNPGQSAFTMWISDCSITNTFQVVATNVPSPIGIDYSSVSNCLLISLNHPYGETNNFARLGTNGILTRWSGIHGRPDEVKIATVKNTINGFTNGDMYFGSDTQIGWLSANAMRSNITWCTLTNGVLTNATYLRGSLYVDQTGTWSNNLIAVSSDSGADPSSKGVWSVDSQARPTLLATIQTPHLEGVVTLTNDPAKWGPWAGKVITGDEDFQEPDGTPKPLIYALGPDGQAVGYPLGIFPEDFDIVQTNQDLYCVNFNGDPSTILKISRDLLTSYVGDLLVTEAGEAAQPARLSIVHWDSATSRFFIRAIALPDTLGSHFEHVTFAPINIPPIAQ
jgi:hypothetical protein